MLSQVVQDAINDQINHELYSSYSYLAMAAYCERQQFTGCARWLRMQSQEEQVHGMRLYDFQIARGGNVVLKAIGQPQAEFKSIANVFEQALEQERQVSQQIDALYELAFKEKAFSALVELEWFITEQVEEERTAREIVHKFHLIKDDPASLLDMDRELGQRSTAATPGASGG
jgi:ferritin